MDRDLQYPLHLLENGLKHFTGVNESVIEGAQEKQNIGGKGHVV